MKSLFHPIVPIISCTCLIMTCGKSTEGGTELALKKSVQEKASSIEMHVMSDQTISWDQPDSDGVAGYNGRCGETAIANLLTMHLGRIVSPQYVIDYGKSDMLPGTRPATMLAALQKLTLANSIGLNQSLTWQQQNLSSNNSLLQLYNEINNPAKPRQQLDLSNITAIPVAVLMQWGRLSYHWVVIVGMEKSNDDYVVRLNHWGRQEVIPGAKFLQMWSYQVTTLPSPTAVILNYSPTAGSRIIMTLK